VVAGSSPVVPSIHSKGLRSVWQVAFKGTIKVHSRESEGQRPLDPVTGLGWALPDLCPRRFLFHIATTYRAECPWEVAARAQRRIPFQSFGVSASCPCSRGALPIWRTARRVSEWLGSHVAPENFSKWCRVSQGDQAFFPQRSSHGQVFVREVKVIAAFRLLRVNSVKALERKPT
jgi:hypothetical protein